MIDEKLLIKELNFRVRTPRSTMEIIRDIIPLVEMQPKVSEQEIRDKAIEKFAEKLKEKYGCLGYVDEISFEEIDEIAEQMKEVEE